MVKTVLKTAIKVEVPARWSEFRCQSGFTWLAHGPGTAPARTLDIQPLSLEYLFRAFRWLCGGGWYCFHSGYASAAGDILNPKPRILFFSKSSGYKHDVVKARGQSTIVFPKRGFTCNA